MLVWTKKYILVFLQYKLLILQLQIMFPSTTFSVEITIYFFDDKCLYFIWKRLPSCVSSVSKYSWRSVRTVLLAFVNIVNGTRLSFFALTITKVESAFRFFTSATRSSIAGSEMEGEVMLILESIREGISLRCLRGF